VSGKPREYDNMGVGLTANSSKTNKDLLIYKTGKRPLGKSGLAWKYKLQGTDELEM
jgi:hypothetical protein